MVSILVADDEEGMRFMLGELLGKEGYTVKEARDGEEAIAMAEREDFDVIILDLKMPRVSGQQALEHIRRLRPSTPVVVITGHGSRDIGYQAIAAGAYDYFEKPLDNTELRIVIKRAIERRNYQREVETLRQEGLVRERQMDALATERSSLEARLRETRQFGKLIGSSQVMLEVYSLIQRIGPRDVTVLILGESGTGKELVAQSIVENSPRRSKPFIKVDCAAIPETLLESELFGHERGAFTGAVLTKPGKFELADGGTILLDEIGELPAGLQAKLLRVLQEREFEHVGGTRPIKVDLRIIAATNADLAHKVADGQFREDLYYRLNVIPITLPPLRKRLEDIPLLVKHFLNLYSRQFGKDVTGVSPEVMEALLSCPWPGNVRQLQNVLQRACILTVESIISVQHLPAEIRELSPAEAQASGQQAAAIVLPSGVLDDSSVPLPERIETLTAQAERELIVRALAKCGGRRQATADLLGISRKTLHNKMAHYGLLEMGKEGYKGV